MLALVLAAAAGALTVTEYDPPRDEHSVLPEAVVKLTFDGPIRLGVASPAPEVVLLAGESKHTRKSVSPDGLSVVNENQLVYVPPKKLAAGQLYTVLIDEGVVKSVDTGEDFIGFSFNDKYRFTVADVTPPRLVKCRPKDDNAPLAPVIQLTFSEEIQPRVGRITVRGDDGFEKKWNVETDVVVDGRVLTAVLAEGEQLQPNTTYEVLIDKGAVWDYPGRNPSEEEGVVGTFRTIADVSPPVLLGTVPAGLGESPGEEAFTLPLVVEWEFDEEVVLRDGACVSGDARFQPWRIVAAGAFLRADLDAKLVQEELVTCEYTIADIHGNSQTQRFSLLAWPEGFEGETPSETPSENPKPSETATREINVIV
jgi:hypothetical protein